MELISASEKAELAKVIDDIHETFARDIYVYKTPTITAISTSGNYNFAFGDDQPSVTASKEVVSASFKARIKHLDLASDSEQLRNIPIDDARFKSTKGLIRLKITQEAYNFIKDSERITVDGRNCILMTNDRPHGLFDTQYITVYLSRMD
jgi:hypothetical protein